VRTHCIRSKRWSDRTAEYARGNPLELGKALINWEDLSAGRYGEWLGNLVPDALLAIGTAGAGTAASRSLRGAKALEDVAEVAPGAKPKLPPNLEMTVEGRVFARTDADGKLVRVPPRDLHTSIGDARQGIDRAGSWSQRLRPPEELRHGTPPPNVKTKRQATGGGRAPG